MDKAETAKVRAFRDSWHLLISLKQTVFSRRATPYVCGAAVAVLGWQLDAQCVSSFFIPVADAAQTKLPAVVTKEYDALEKLFKQYYSSAKVVRTANGIHVEYRLKKREGSNSKSNQRIVAPEAGGILCDISLKPGKCTEVQSTKDDRMHSTQTLGTYSGALKSHLLAKLVYPDNDCASDFRDKFTELIKNFGRPSDSTTATADDATESAVSARHPMDPSKPQHAHEISLADVANKPLPPELPGLLPSDQSKDSKDTGGSASPSQPPLDYLAMVPPKRQSRFASKYDNQTPDQAIGLFNMEEFPSTLPEIIAGPMKLSASKNIKLEQEKPKPEQSKVDVTKNMPEGTAFQSAQAAMKKGQYSLAAKMYSSLAAKHPKEPRYFYGAGAAYRMMGDNRSAYSNFVIAWHLGGMQPEYGMAAEDTVHALQAEIDQSFKLTWGWQSSDPEVLLNAGSRCWRAGLTQQSTQLFAYAMKNEPLYAGVAAFDLGATAEHNGQFKLALQYYDWAEKVTLRLEQAQAQSPMYSGQINKVLGLLPLQDIEQARSDVMYKLKIQDTRWTGWEQATSYPAQGMSEICPTCKINRRSQSIE